MSIPTVDKARLIQAVALIELCADELAEAAAGQTLASLLRRMIGTMPDEVAGDGSVQPAANLVRKALDKASSPANVAAAIAKRARQAQQMVRDGSVSPGAEARAIQLLGQAAALADRVLNETQRAPRPKTAPAPKADLAPAAPAPASGGMLANLVQSVKDNPIPALALTAGVYFAASRRR